jgi:hypothetical protein
MRYAGCFALLLLVGSSSARAQEGRDTWSVGVTGAAGFPAARVDGRLSLPMTPTIGIDLSAGHLAGNLGGDDSFGPIYITSVRWMRGGRASSGASRYWIFGTHLVGVRQTTPVIFPGRDTQYLVEHKTLVVPRIGYGWDRVSRRGIRAGLELTTGAAGEEAPFVFANVFLMVGPPRR